MSARQGATGKSGASSKHRSNTTGKSGNASGSARREARGDSAKASGRGKHPPNQLFTAPQQERKRRRALVDVGPGKRQSDRG